MNNQKTPFLLPSASCLLPACPELAEGLPPANYQLFLETNPCPLFCYELQETLIED
jgi:hypothetical protein